MATSLSHFYKITALFVVLLSCCINAGAQTRTIRTQHGKLVYKITNLGDTITVAKEENPNDPIFFTRIVNSNVVGDKLSAGTEINIDLTYYPDDNGSGVCSNLSIQADECLTCLDPDPELLDIFPKTYKGSQEEYIPDNPQAMGYCFGHHTRISPHHINHTFRVNHDITENQHLFAIEVNYLVWNNTTKIDCYGGYDEVTRYWELVRVNFVDEPLGRENPVDIIPFDVDLFNRLMDYFGLDQHATPEEATTVALISILLSLLLGGGIGAVGGGVGGLAGGTMPPPVDGPGYLPPDQNPYQDVENKYVTRNPDGSITVKDPITGESRLYLPDGHGGYDNPLGGGFQSETQMLEHLAMLDRNSDLLSQDAETAERNQREQHEAWKGQSKRDFERGYSDEMKAYRDWKAEQERIQKKEEYVEKLADKYHTTVDKLKDKIRQVQAAAEEESHYQQEIAKHWDRAVTVATVVDNTCEFAVNVMGECVPGGRLVKNVYTFAKAPLVAVSEAYADGKGLAEGTAHVVAGLGKGALGVIQNQAGDLTKNPLGEYAITVGTEMVKDGMTVYEKTGDFSKTMYGMINSGGKKTGDFLLGKLVSGGLNKLKTGAEQSLQKGIININDDAGIRMKPETAKKILNFFNPKGGLNSTGAKGWNVEINGANSPTFNADMNKWKLGDLSKNFSVKGTTNVSSGGQVDLAGMFTTKTTEAASKFGLHDWEGQTAEGLTRDAVNLKTDLSNFKQALVNRAKEYGRNHPRQ